MQSVRPKLLLKDSAPCSQYVSSYFSRTLLHAVSTTQVTSQGLCSMQSVGLKLLLKDSAPCSQYDPGYFSSPSVKPTTRCTRYTHNYPDSWLFSRLSRSMFCDVTLRGLRLSQQSSFPPPPTSTTLRDVTPCRCSMDPQVAKGCSAFTGNGQVSKSVLLPLTTPSS
jgi:hypothetical protein